MESLHNIQADSTAFDNIGTIVVGEEDYGFGHVGATNPITGDDCWGCHGFFKASAAADTGPITPYISDSTKELIIAGTDTSITLSGSSFTNYSGTTEYKSIFKLTAQDGSEEYLTLEELTNSSATLIIPGNTPAGNYKLRAVKMGKNYMIWSLSNPVSISVKEPIVIGSQTVRSTCGGCKGEMTITGSGFGDQSPAGAEIYINVMQNTVPLNITTWSDTLITATGAACDGSEITVNGLFGSATK
jgi:hypothetical protein